MDTRIEEVIEYWLGDAADSLAAAEARRELWYRGGPDLDREIERRFGPLVLAARGGALCEWEQSAEGALALVILLDQFTRNIYRGTAEAYSGDALAMEAAERTVESGRDLPLPVVGRIFLYHPYHHSESLAHQNRAVALVAAIEETTPVEWHPYIRHSVEGFGHHRDVVARFGRFPHRNRLLGRPATAEELAYLEGGGEHYGQE